MNLYSAIKASLLQKAKPCIIYRLAAPKLQFEYWPEIFIEEYNRNVYGIIPSFRYYGGGWVTMGIPEEWLDADDWEVL